MQDLEALQLALVMSDRPNKALRCAAREGARTDCSCSTTMGLIYTSGKLEAYAAQRAAVHTV